MSTGRQKRTKRFLEDVETEWSIIKNRKIRKRRCALRDMEHLGGRFYHCHWCDRRFGSQAEWRRHLGTVPK